MPQTNQRRRWSPKATHTPKPNITRPRRPSTAKQSRFSRGWPFRTKREPTGIKRVLGALTGSKPRSKKGRAAAAGGFAAAGGTAAVAAVAVTVTIVRRRRGGRDLRQLWSCDCGQTYFVSGIDRHRVYWLPDAPQSDPLLVRDCVSCGAELPARHEAAVV